jgi:D-3-phosphoglycerate dehydrogenase
LDIVYKVRTYNQISVKGLEQLPRESYEVASEITNPDGIMLRSYKLPIEEVGSTVKAIARAGAGVNNIPLAACTERGIPVFNAPGANANAVKELVIAGLLLGSRGIVEGIDYARTLSGMHDYKAMSALLEKEKKQFKGNELAGKVLGVVGLGAIGSRVAQTALLLGMEVVGFDPALSVDAAWRLPSEVKKMENLAALFARSHYVSLHLPALDSTRNLVNADALRSFRDQAVLLNFARDEIVDVGAVRDALQSGKLRKYISDFPHPELLQVAGNICMPHIGASTDEAEDNCAIMVARQLRDFLENGNIVNSVNFPSLQLERNGGSRLAITNYNVPKMLGQVTSVLADANINVIDLLNKSRGDIAYNLLDIETAPSADVVAKLGAVQGVINVRLL